MKYIRNEIVTESSYIFQNKKLNQCLVVAIIYNVDVISVYIYIYMI